MFIFDKMTTHCVLIQYHDHFTKFNVIYFKKSWKLFVQAIYIPINKAGGVYRINMYIPLFLPRSKLCNREKREAHVWH